MSTAILLAVSTLGVLPWLLRRGRPMLAAIALFAVADGALLLRVHRDLSAVASPGPDARALAIVFLAPTVVFLLAGGIRMLVEVARRWAARTP